MARWLPIFRGSSGLNTVSDPKRVRFDGDSGVRDLTIGTNVVVEDDGRITMRRGYSDTEAVSAAAHSLWASGQHCLFVSGTTLYRMAADYSLTSVRTSMANGLRVRFAAVHGLPWVFYGNGEQRGWIRGDTHYDWDMGDLTYELNDKIPRTNVSTPHVLDYYRGRMWLGVGEYMQYTEALAMDRVRVNECIIPYQEGRLGMIAAVDDGLYVSTGRGVYFEGGDDPANFNRLKVHDHPAIEGTEAKIEANWFFEDIPGTAVVFTTQAGIFLGLNGGRVIPLTSSRLKFINDSTIGFPIGSRGAGAVMGQHYVTLIEP